MLNYSTLSPPGIMLWAAEKKNVDGITRARQYVPCTHLHCTGSSGKHARTVTVPENYRGYSASKNPACK